MRRYDVIQNTYDICYMILCYIEPFTTCRLRKLPSVVYMCIYDDKVMCSNIWFPVSDSFFVEKANPDRRISDCLAQQYIISYCVIHIYIIFYTSKYIIRIVVYTYIILALRCQVGRERIFFSHLTNNMIRLRCTQWYRNIKRKLINKIKKNRCETNFWNYTCTPFGNLKENHWFESILWTYCTYCF